MWFRFLFAPESTQRSGKSNLEDVQQRSFERQQMTLNDIGTSIWIIKYIIYVLLKLISKSRNHVHLETIHDHHKIRPPEIVWFETSFETSYSFKCGILYTDFNFYFLQYLYVFIYIYMLQITLPIVLLLSEHFFL